MESSCVVNTHTRQIRIAINRIGRQRQLRTLTPSKEPTLPEFPQSLKKTVFVWFRFVGDLREFFEDRKSF
jgi:hypothetical protein